MDFAELFPVRIHNPETNQIDWEIFAVAHVFHEDGFSNLEELFVIHDEMYQYWVSPSDDWILHEQNDEYWIAVPRLHFPHAQIHSGTYRIVLIDSSGAQDERDFFVAEVPPDDGLQPVLQVSDGSITVKSEHQEHRIAAYRAGGRHIATVDTQDSDISFESITSERGEIHLHISSLEPYNGYLFRSGPYIVQR